MDSKEQNVRNHLKTLTVEDIANSTYLFGLDFDKDSMDKIMGYMSALLDETKILKNMVDRNFESIDHELIPKDPVTQEIVRQNAARKYAALMKALSNEDTYNMFVEYKAKESQKEEVPTR